MSDRKVFEVRLVCFGEGDGIPERRVVLIAGQDVVVGRASTNRGVAAAADNTKINNPVISKEHASFTTDPSGTTVLIRDLKSMHGTRVDDRELSQGEECEIRSGSTLQFGSAVIRGNVTYKPAKYTFYADPVNHPNAFSSTLSAPTAATQSQAFSDTKKGYGDDSSLYSDDYDFDDDMEEDDYMSNNEHADVTMIPDTYSSEQDSDASPKESIDSSSDGSADESEQSDGMSVEDYCPLNSVVTADAAAETSSTAAVAGQTSFCSSYLEGSSELLCEQTSSTPPAGEPMGLDMSGTNGGWPDHSELDQPIYYSPSSQPWTSELIDTSIFNMPTEEHQNPNKLNILQVDSNKARPFSNSINDLCEPAPEADATPSGSAPTVPKSDVTKVASISGPSPIATAKSSVGREVNMMEDIQRLPQEHAVTANINAGIKTEVARAKRTAAEADLDADNTGNVVDSLQATQAATPEQMSNRRIASFSRRARDFGLGAVVGGVALFTWLVNTPGGV
ncbi:hypothetical protein B0J12DRAFT_676060 [Macrophomina phaseolina]|uniref:FHA domain-containing protein n=1 Tax=Macrophomina phaseolina TaxID=35725 RepID=A0ABQ8G055_9PEZI|nr:hypothetical protein B0J12DRAFT_676060 [Macrophomina phaseolina]